MTAISPTDAANSAAATTNALGKTSADFNMFLKLLTTQMQNQDPLKPMDSTEYTQQLAQFSQVEQTIQQTDTLKGILSHLTGQDLMQASAMIGQEAAFATAASGLDGGTPAQWGYAADRQAESLVATIRNAAGNVVVTRSLDPAATSGRFAWDGTQDDGTHATNGTYTLSIAATDTAGASVPTTITSIGTIHDVSAKAGTVMAGVAGAQLPITSLIGLSVMSR
jgi:flagellar basal-body rod modification protein FlgD